MQDRWMTMPPHQSQWASLIGAKSDSFIQLIQNINHNELPNHVNNEICNNNNNLSTANLFSTDDKVRNGPTCYKIAQHIKFLL